MYPCWRPSTEGDGLFSNSFADDYGRSEGLLWYKDYGRHVYGDFSMAVVQANNIVEDQSQLVSGSMSSVDCGPQGTFVGVYDGHGGPEAARFINNHLFDNIKSMVFFLYIYLSPSPMASYFYFMLTDIVMHITSLLSFFVLVDCQILCGGNLADQVHL